MIPAEITELQNQINVLIDHADKPLFTSLDEIEAAITLVISRLTDEKRPIFQNDTALLGKIMTWLDYSFSEYRRQIETPNIP